MNDPEKLAYQIPKMHSALVVSARLAGLGGAFHVGVQVGSTAVMCLAAVGCAPRVFEVYWLEWSFGWCEDGSGIQAICWFVIACPNFSRKCMNMIRMLFELGLEQPQST